MLLDASRPDFDDWALLAGRGGLDALLGTTGGAANRIGEVCTRRRHGSEEDDAMGCRRTVLEQSINAGRDMME